MSLETTNQLLELSATIDLKDLGTVHRLGFGAMRIVGDGIWGEPSDRVAAVDVVRRAVELGVDFINTANSYGPNISEEILAEALHPYKDGLKIATKGASPAPHRAEQMDRRRPPRIPAPADGIEPTEA